LKRIITIISIAAIVFLTYLNSPATADNNSNGAKVFQANCAACHAQGGNIMRWGKNLKLKALSKNKVDTKDAIALLVANGKNSMSAYSDRLTNQEIQDVAAYVLERAEQSWQ
jgi:cytochrome c6